MRAALLLSLLLVACGADAEPATRGDTSGAESPELELPGLSTEGLAVLARMNEWCTAQADECDVAERPDAHPGRAASGETNGWIHSHREQAAEHGITAVWDVGGRRFVPQVEHDLGLIIGGHFSPDHLGPDVHAAIIERARARAPLYLGVLMERVLVDDPGWLSSMHVQNVPRLVAEVARAEARAVSERLLVTYRQAAAASDPPPADDEYRLTRLQDRIRTLEALAS